MSISPTSNSPFQGPMHPLSPVVQKLLALYNDWFNAVESNDKANIPSTTNALLSFLNNSANQTALNNDVAGIPCPFPDYTETFEDTLKNSIARLTEWQQHGYPSEDLAGVAEFIYDVIQWAGLGPVHR